MELRRVLAAMISGVAAAVVFQAPATAATTLYVATGGNDANAGTLSAPPATIHQAISLITAGAAAPAG